jgi:DNA-binding transcriptional regulator PaaX
MSLVEQNQKIVTRYREAGQPWPASSVDIARWAIAKKLWDIHPAKIVRQCADQIAEALRQEYITDPQGRRVRVKHVAPYPVEGQTTFKWDDMRSATHLHMQTAFAYKRQLIVSDCWQLKMEIDSYNENYNKAEPIQSVFDFIDDLAELEIQAKEHPRQAA